MITIPNQETKLWRQDNSSDLGGNMSVTKNMTLDQEGYLKLSNSARAVMNETIDADFDNPAVILYSEDFGFFTETWERPFSVDSDVLSRRPTEITGSDSPDGDIQSDAVWFGGLMVVTSDTKVSFYDPVADTWTETNITLSSTFQSQHALANFLSMSALAVADVFQVNVYDNPITATPTLLTTLNILKDFYITGMVYFNQNLYIATMNRYGGNAYLYVWNGQGSAAQGAYEVDSNMIFSICVHKDSIVILAANGALLRFNGSGFDMLDAFPIYYTDRALTDVSNIGMYKNIMKSNGDLLYIFFSDRGSSRKILNQPDGIWCYDERVGLYHRYASSNSLVGIVEPSAVSATTDAFTVSSAPVTGTEVFYRQQADPIGGLVNEKKYFVIKVDATHVQLAKTRADALAGTPIDITSTAGSIITRLVFFPNVDFGQSLGRRTMSIALIDRPREQTQYGTDLIWGSEVNNRTMTGNVSVLGSVSSAVESRGYMITPKIFSSDVTDVFNKITLKVSAFQSELDKIIIKYRVTDDRRDEINLAESPTAWRATWTSINSFTTTQEDFANALKGDEIEILTGAGAGILAHITSITELSGVYTVVIDENFDNYLAGDIAVVVFRNWKKWQTIAYGDAPATLGYMSEQLGMSGKFLQLKFDVRGIGTRIEGLIVDNKFQLPAKV